MNVKPNERRFLIALIAVTGAAWGCFTGPSPVVVSGHVTIADQPVASGVISFIPSSDTSGPSCGVTITQGAYEISSKHGLVPGLYRVEVTIFPQPPEGNTSKANKPASQLARDESDSWAVSHPPQYFNSPTQTAELHVGDNTFDLALKQSP